MKKIFLLLLMSIVSLTIQSETLKIAMQISPPFVMDDVNGSYTGLLVDMWEKTATDLDIEYEYISYQGSISEMLTDINKGNFTLGLSSTTINSERMKKTEFLQPFYITDVSIASNIKKNNILSFISNIFSIVFLKYVFTLIFVLLIIAIFIWLAEHNSNDSFDDNPLIGIGQAFYFTSVVMTTVGFGDMAAKTNLGRFIVTIWMFISLGITGVFIGNISSAITVNRLDTGIHDITALHKLKVGSMLNTTSSEFLNKKGIKYIGYDTAEEGLNDIKDGRLDAFVYDTPILKYYIKNNNYDISLSDITFDMQYYGIPINCERELQNCINSKMVDYINSDLWELTLIKYNLQQ